MRFVVAAVGQRMPVWVQDAWQEYARRFPRGLALELREVPLLKRSRNANIHAIRDKEGEALLAATPAGAHIIALDERGRQWSTSELAQQMASWMLDGLDVGFLIGGPDGLSRSCLDRARNRWSLGALTLPHPMVRVILAEQLYRAWSITQNHPYHRA
jgi:23S rRNA (pseudouridine1915-N3)-methyltransferase